MQFFRVGSRTRRHGFCGAVCGSGRADGTTDDVALAAARGYSGTVEFHSQRKTVESSNISVSVSKASPLQFILDDLASPSLQPMRAFRRAVCVPFQPAAAASSVRAALELKVRILLLDSRARCRCSDVQAMATLLTQQGLRALVMHPGRAQGQMSPFSMTLGAPFLVVTSGDGDDDMVVVDGVLREHLLVAPCTPAYQRTLAATVPELFIGSLSRLQQLVTSMASAISLNFASQGVDTPPWRRTAALLSRWAVVKERQAAELVVAAAPPSPLPVNSSRLRHWTAQAPAAATPPLLPPNSSAMSSVWSPAGGDGGARCCAPGEADVATRCDAGSPEEAAQADPEGQVHGGASEARRHRPFVVVRGFEVDGSELPARVVRQCQEWPGVKPGGLASLCRKQSGGTPDSSTESEGGWGASPASVFRGE